MRCVCGEENVGENSEMLFDDGEVEIVVERGEEFSGVRI